jgi:hypothetical protein
MDRDEKGRFVKGHSVPEEVRQKLSRPRPRIWSKAELDLLKQFYPQKTSEELAKIIEGKTIGQIISKAHKLKLRKTDETLRRMRRGQPSHRKGLTLEEEYGPERAREIRQKVSESRKGIRPNRSYDNPPKYWLGKRIPKEIREKIAQTLRNGASSFYHFKDHPEWRRRNLESCTKKPSGPERKLIDIIKRHHLPFEYTGNGKIIIGMLNPDFVHNDGRKKVIEIFGRVFHDPEVTFKNDVPWYRQYWGRMAYYAQFGYDCLILWDDELGDENAVINKIRGFIE